MGSGRESEFFQQRVSRGHARTAAATTRGSDAAKAGEPHGRKEGRKEGGHVGGRGRRLRVKIQSGEEASEFPDCTTNDHKRPEIAISVLSSRVVKYPMSIIRVHKSFYSSP